MNAEHYPPSIVNRLANTGSSVVPKGYYRSKLFIAPLSTNTLVAAAGPVLSLLERLCLSPSLPSIADIRDNIAHELHAFYSKLQASHYTAEQMNLAYYLLATTVDELLGKNYIRVYNEAPDFQSFTPLTHDGSQPEKRFFEIVNYVKERPNQYLDLLELIYFCLIAGFEGTYHLKVDGRQSLDNHIELLYQLIQQYRFNKPHRLFNENPIPKAVKNNYKATLLTLLITTGLVTIAFLTSHTLLENKAKNVLFGHTQLAMLDN
jgi:type IV/VI secretion system ImpK/VasF family protein